MAESKTKAGALLRKAAEIVDGNRNSIHGEKERSFIAIAAMWEIYRRQRREPEGPIRPVDVANMMTLLKQQRAEWGTPVEDHYLDAAGYAAVAWEVSRLPRAWEPWPEPGPGPGPEPGPGPKTPTKPTYFYLASPYRAYPDGPEAAWACSENATRKLVATRIPVFCPILHTHRIADAAPPSISDEMSFWLIQDRPLLLASSGLILLTARGWQDSEGMRIERKIAEEAGLPTFYWDGASTTIAYLLVELEQRAGFKILVES